MEEGIDEPSAIRGDSDVDDSQGQSQRSSSQLGRKRASSSKESDAKKMKVVMDRLVDAIEKPMRLENVVIRTAQESWLERAMEMYAKDFSWNHIRVEQRLKRKWINNSHTALEFAAGTQAYRLDIVESAARAVGHLRDPPPHFGDNDGNSNGGGNDNSEVNDNNSNDSDE